MKCVEMLKIIYSKKNELTYTFKFTIFIHCYLYFNKIIDLLSRFCNRYRIRLR